MTYQEAIQDWDNYRSGPQIKASKPDEFSIAMGEADICDPRYYGYDMVEKALCRYGNNNYAWYLLAKDLLTEVHCMGRTIDSYNKMHFGWQHRQVVSKVLKGIYAEIENAIKANPRQDPKGFETA